MKIRTRLILSMVVLVSLGFCGLIYWIIDDLRPRYLATMEEGMVDTATLFAGFLETRLEGETIRIDQFRAAYRRADGGPVSAQIFEEYKNRLEMRVYVTDRGGIVLFDSDNGRDEGKDYSRWRDVALSLRGEYGARTTPEVPGEAKTSVLYVGAPIRTEGGEIVGVVTVCKRAASATRFLIWARKRIILTGLLAAGAIALLGMIVYARISIPIERLTRYAIAVRDGRRVPPPAFGRDEIGQLAVAFEEMKDALEGKEYVNQYVQTLTHEMKSPLSAIRGAAELLDESMPADQRARFLENIRAEVGRIQDLIDRLLQLSALEQRKGLIDAERIDLAAFLRDVAEAMSAVITARGLSVQMEKLEPVFIRGERFLLRQALDNVLRNAVDFSPRGGTITIAVEPSDNQARLVVADQGPGIPDYALARVFDRFYSLQRPETGKRSSGLGLTIVREVLTLHGGTIMLENAPSGGARAALSFPLA